MAFDLGRQEHAHAEQAIKELEDKVQDVCRQLNRVSKIQPSGSGKVAASLVEKIKKTRTDIVTALESCKRAAAEGKTFATDVKNVLSMDLEAARGSPEAGKNEFQTRTKGLTQRMDTLRTCIEDCSNDLTVASTQLVQIYDEAVAEAKAIKDKIARAAAMDSLANDISAAAEAAIDNMPTRARVTRAEPQNEETSPSLLTSFNSFEDIRNKIAPWVRLVATVLLGGYFVYSTAQQSKMNRDVETCVALQDSAGSLQVAFWKFSQEWEKVALKFEKRIQPTDYLKKYEDPKKKYELNDEIGSWESIENAFENLQATLSLNLKSILAVDKGAKKS